MATAKCTTASRDGIVPISSQSSLLRNLPMFPNRCISRALAQEGRLPDRRERAREGDSAAFGRGIGGLRSPRRAAISDAFSEMLTRTFRGAMAAVAARVARGS